MPLSRDQFVRHLLDSGLYAPAALSSLLDTLPEAAKADGEKLAKELVKQNKLTKFQAQRVYEGKGKKLVLGNYRILDKLGQGGMGMVLKAEHSRMRRQVALKVMSAAAVKSKEAVQRFQREVQAAAKLDHPNIVPAYDADEADGTHFLVMQFVEGHDLAGWVKANGPMPWPKAVDCLIQAARGLEYAHQRGVIHRDIKPANLLLDGNGTIRILDMGLARMDVLAGDAQADLTATGQIMGTIDYMAPEQAVNPKLADKRADIYSLGMTLWFLLTGRHAYDAPSMMGKLLAHREMAIPSLTAACPGIPAPLEAVFRKMAAKTPEERYQSLTPVIADLERCRTGAPVAAAVAVPARREDSALSDFLRGVTDTDAGTGTREDGSGSETRLTARGETQFGSGSLAKLLGPLRSKAKRAPLPTSWIAGGVTAGLVLVIGLVIVFSQRAAGPRAEKTSRRTAPAVELDEPKETTATSVTAPTTSASTAVTDPDEANWTYLFNGVDQSGWVSVNGTPPNWTVVQGALEVGNAPSIQTAADFPPDLEVHVEFWLPAENKTGQSRANSGVFLLGRHEVQILDMHQNANVPGIQGCGALYGMIAPKPGAWTLPKMWQTFRIRFNSPRPRRLGELTLIHNGLTVIDKQPVQPFTSPAALDQKLGERGPIMLQSHGSPVRFRNLKVRAIPPLP